MSQRIHAAAPNRLRVFGLAVIASATLMLPAVPATARRPDHRDDEGQSRSRPRPPRLRAVLGGWQHEWRRPRRADPPGVPLDRGPGQRNAGARDQRRRHHERVRVRGPARRGASRGREGAPQRRPIRVVRQRSCRDAGPARRSRRPSDARRRASCARRRRPVRRHRARPRAGPGRWRSRPSRPGADPPGGSRAGSADHRRADVESGHRARRRPRRAGRRRLRRRHDLRLPEPGGPARRVRSHRSREASRSDRRSTPTRPSRRPAGSCSVCRTTAGPGRSNRPRSGPPTIPPRTPSRRAPAPRTRRPTASRSSTASSATLQAARRS